VLLATNCRCRIPLCRSHFVCHHFRKPKGIRHKWRSAESQKQDQSAFFTTDCGELC